MARATDEGRNSGGLREVAPYSGLASFYDQLMHHVDYVHWSRLLEALLAEGGIVPPAQSQAPALLECACGTGTVAAMLALRGYDVTAFDRSPAMVRLAKQKGAGARRWARCFISDLRQFHLRVPQDALFCLYDSVNYLLKAEELAMFFECARQSLRPGGALIFDICTEYNSREYFNGGVDEGSGPGFRFTRRMRYLQKERLQENVFEILSDFQGGEILVERHWQRIYATKEVRSFLRRSGFHIVRETDGFTLRNPSRESLRIHFLAKRVD